MLLLLFDSLRQMAERITGALDVAPRFLPLRAIHMRSGAVQPPAGTLGDRRQHLQIAQ
jgi:hypothetical protein